MKTAEEGRNKKAYFFRKNCLREQEIVSSRDPWIRDDSEHSHNNGLFLQEIKSKVAQRTEILLCQDLSGNIGREEWVPVKFARHMNIPESRLVR